MSNILRYGSAAYLLFIMLIKMMSMPIALLDYNLNRNFIAASLCENRFAPEAHCEGKCYLKKQLHKTSEAPDATEHKSSGRDVVVDFFEPARPLSQAFFLAQPARQRRLSLGKISTPFISSVFHPPLAPFA